MLYLNYYYGFNFIIVESKISIIVQLFQTKKNYISRVFQSFLLKFKSKDILIRTIMFFKII